MKPLLLLLSLFSCALHAQGPSNFDYRPATVVIYNEKEPGSEELARYYIKQRGIPESNLVGLICSDKEVISREEFIETIETPLRNAFTLRKWWETAQTPQEGLLAVKTTMRVFAIMQGIPLKISAAPQPKEKDPKTGKEIPDGPLSVNTASVDSELAAFGVLEKKIAGIVNNPYFNLNTSFAKVPLTPMFLTGRLDGPDKAIPRRLIDDAIAVEKSGLYGKAYIDLAQKNAEGYKAGEDWLKGAARRLETAGVPVIMDTWGPTLPQNFPATDCAYYLGWYTGTVDGPFVNPNFKFRRGAVACHLHSFSASSLRTKDQAWCGPLLNKGACAVLGNVYEPYLMLTASLDTFTDRLLAGYNLGEAAWMSHRALSWMNVVIGDPLYRPFAADPGAGDKKTDQEYKAIRLAMQRWGGEKDSDDLNDNLSKAAASLKSVAIYEFLALHSQAGDADSFAWRTSKKWFKLALEQTQDIRQQIQLRLLSADAQRRDGEWRNAARTLTEIIEQYPGAPETAAARAWLQEVRKNQ